MDQDIYTGGYREVRRVCRLKRGALVEYRRNYGQDQGVGEPSFSKSQGLGFGG